MTFPEPEGLPPWAAPGRSPSSLREAVELLLRLGTPLLETCPEERWLEDEERTAAELPWREVELWRTLEELLWRAGALWRETEELLL